jgi:hypothetical protein
LAAGAGPPANKIATRRIDPGVTCEFEGWDSAELIGCSNNPGFFLEPIHSDTNRDR